METPREGFPLQAAEAQDTVQEERWDLPGLTAENSLEKAAAAAGILHYRKQIRSSLGDFLETKLSLSLSDRRENKSMVLPRD